MDEWGMGYGGNGGSNVAQSWRGEGVERSLKWRVVLEMEIRE